MSAAAGDIFAGLFARGPVAEQLSDRAFIQAVLDVELALARALVGAGLAPEQAAAELEPIVADAEWLDLDELGRLTGKYGTPIPGVLGALRERLGPGRAASHLHQGATSQDIVDTASMLVANRVVALVLSDLEAAAESCAALADRHRRTVMPGRTLLQQGAPITFGLKAAGWLNGLAAARTDLTRVRDTELAVQLGGAVGNLAGFEAAGVRIMNDVAEQLGLAVPVMPWHTIRTRPARLAAALGSALGVMAKIALDVVLLAQTEVAEAREGGDEQRGGSSAMPHKRNPVTAVAILACAQRSPGLVATVLSAMTQEHERAVGGWQGEWPALAELLRLAGSAASASRELLDQLDVDPRRMRQDIVELSLSQQVTAELGKAIGSTQAREIVEAVAHQVGEGDDSFRELLLQVPEVRDGLGAEGLDRALSPDSYLGASDELIDRALAAHRG